MTKISRGLAVGLLCALPLMASPLTAAPQEKRPDADDRRPARTESARDERSDKVLRDAITELEAVKSRVHGAAHVYGGHRGKADEYIDMAAAELRAALKYDERTERK